MAVSHLFALALMIFLLFPSQYFGMVPYVFINYLHKFYQFIIIVWSQKMSFIFLKVYFSISHIYIYTFHIWKNVFQYEKWRKLLNGIIKTSIVVAFQNVFSRPNCFFSPKMPFLGTFNVFTVQLFTVLMYTLEIESGQNITKNPKGSKPWTQRIISLVVILKNGPKKG